MYLGLTKARDTIERLYAAANPYAVTRADLMDAVRLVPRAELADLFAGDSLLANFVLNHWEYAHGAATLVTLPWNVVIPISDVCNARCTFCNSWLRGKRLLKLVDLERFSPVLRTAAMISLEGHGEPLVHPQFREIVQTLRRAVDRRCRFSIITNGLLLDVHLDDLLDLGVNVFNVSLNAASPSVHDEVMGLGANAFVRVTGTLRELIRRGGTLAALERPAVNLSLVVTAANIHEIPAFIRLAEDMGASQVNLRTLLPQTELLAGLNYHVLPAYLAPDFEGHVAAANAAIAEARVTIDVDVASWSKPVFPEAVQKRIDIKAPDILSRREGQRVIMMQKEDFRGLEKMTSKGELLVAGQGDPRWTSIEAETAGQDGPARKAWFKCADVYTTLHMNDFFFVLRPCCYMDAVPNHDVIKYDGTYDFSEAWNSAAMVSLRRRLHAGPLYSMCTRCPQQPQYPLPEHHLDDYEWVPDGVGAWQRPAEWDAQIDSSGGDGVQIVTPASQWAYAAKRPIRVPAGGIGGCVSVDMVVVEGAVGVGLLHASGETFVTETIRSAGEAAGPVNLTAGDLSKSPALIVRNALSGGKRSRAQIRSVKLHVRKGIGALTAYRVNREILTLNDMEPAEGAATAEWLERDDEYSEIPGAAGTWEAETVLDAQVLDQGTAGLAIVTPWQQWAYAATMPLQALASVAAGRVRIDVCVVEGAVGFTLVDGRKEKFATEVIRDAHSPDKSVVFRLGDLSKLERLIVRNVQPGGGRSRVLVRSVVVQKRLATGTTDEILLNPEMQTLNTKGNPNEPAGAFGTGGQSERGLRLAGKAVPWSTLATATIGTPYRELRGAAIFRARIVVTHGQVVIGLLDRAGTGFVSQTFWGKTAEPLDLVLHCNAIENVSAFVIRASNLVDPPPILIVCALEVALQKEEPPTP